MKKIFNNLLIILIHILGFTSLALANDVPNTQTPTRLTPTEPQQLELKSIVTEIPNTSLKTLKKSFSKESLEPWMWILGSTGILYYYDEDILRDLQHAGRDLNIGNKDNTKSVIKIGDKDILRLPSDTGSYMYFLGDGWLHMSIAAGFLARGYSTASTRPINTGIELVHGMIVSTIFNQALKRTFGREDPNASTEYRGAWHPLPNIAQYNKNTSTYDGMPSGHIMTATLTFTVINYNYPEYSKWIKIIGGTWVTILGFEMVNNGVHWASDYPLGIAMGYLIGKLSAEMGDTKQKPDLQSTKSNEKFMFYPQAIPDGLGIAAVYKF